MRTIGCATAIGVAMVASDAQARDFLYPWRPGTTLEQVSNDQGGCMTEARAVESQVGSDEQRRLRDRSAPPPPPAGKSWLAPGLDGQNAFYSRYYDCLRGRGYSIRRMPSREYGAMRKGPEGGRAVMQAMVAPGSPHAEVPPGTIK